MSDGRLEELDRIFNEARELPASDRAEFVARACGTNDSLHAEVWSLLTAETESGEFMTEPAFDRLAQAIAQEGWSVRSGESIGPYTIVQLLGSGGAGEVWRARDERLGRDVAIKVLLPHFASDGDRLRRFAEEARTVGALNHSNILTIYDVGEHHGIPYLVSECLEGQSLRRRMDAGPIPVTETVAIASGICRGLSAAHARSIVHRDLKPENTFLRSDAVVKILDFGLAKLQQFLEGNPTAVHHTMTGVIVGTAGYMAPEQLRGDAVDARTDLFALGVMLYEMLTGQHPFRRTSTFETLHTVLTADPPDVALTAHVPPTLARIVMRLLQKTPAARFQSAADVLWALEQVENLSPASAAPPQSNQSKQPWLSIRVLWATVIISGALALSAAWVYFTLASRKPDAPLARVRHPNVVTIYGAERIAGRVGLWMEFVKGRTLENVLRDGKAFSAAEVTRIGVELSRAVSAVHRAGLLHRDIKAHNVMVADDDGRVVLMDFGTGRELDGSETEAAGTPLYLAPEVLAGGPASAASDVYSIGVLLYRLLTGAYPVQARDLPELRRAHSQRARADLRSARPDAPQRLARVIERALDPEPGRRFANADALQAALERLNHVRPLFRAAYATAAVFAVGAIGWIVLGTRVRELVLPTGPVAPAAAGVVSVNAPAIVVVPFKNLSSRPDSDDFVDGLTAEIIRNLAVIDGLQVRSQTSSFFFKDKPRNLREIGEQLQANLAVEGSVHVDGRRLRINAQLVQIAGDVPLWSERFDRPLEDVFAIQDEISRAIVNKLRLTLGRGQRRYQTNAEAYELYLRARALLDRLGSDNGARAIPLLEQVIAKDPMFAPAYAGLADGYALMSHEIESIQDGTGLSPDEGLLRMRPAAVKALELDPLLAEAHAAMGLTYSRELDWLSAQQSFRRAIELNPSLTAIHETYASRILVPLGQPEEAERILNAALQADPLSLDVRRALGFAQIVAGRYDEAIANAQQVLAIDPDWPFAKLMLARALTFAGRPAEAIAVRERDGAAGEIWLARAYLMTGRRADVERMVAAQNHPYRRALLYAALNDKDRAFEALNRAVEILPHRVALLLVFPEMALLRGDARLAGLRQKLRLP